jgi:hydroxypyruvate isomerase
MLRFDANITMLYRERALVDRFAAAKRDGFSAVEILSPEDASIDELSAAATDAGVDVVLCNAPMGDFLEGGPGLSAVPGRESDFRDAMEQARQMAVSLGCPTVHIGPARLPPGVDRGACLDILTANLALAAGILDGDGIVATIEPMNTFDFPDVCLNRVSEALAILDAAGRPNTALQFDIYHMARMEPEWLSIIEGQIDRIGHFQFADVPGRHEPGSGELDFDRAFELINRLDYAGSLGAEYVPASATSDSLAWFDKYRGIA